MTREGSPQRRAVVWAPSRLAALLPAGVIAVPLAVHAGIGSERLPAALRHALAGFSGVSHAVLYLALGLMFGRSLLPGRVALGAALAARVEPRPTPALLAYARRVTWVWTGFCALELAGSAALAVGAPASVWSSWVNLADLPLVLALFLGEYAVRRLRFRRQPVATLRQSLGAAWTLFVRRAG